MVNDMKKKLTAIFILLSVLFTASCESGLINDADTGEINLSENKYSYSDGTYICGYDYYDENGYFAAMKMDIVGGIIKSVRFDYFDKKGNALSEAKSEALAETISNLKSTRRSLYTQTLANQRISGIQYSKSDRFTTDYLSLASDILFSAANSYDKVIIKESINKYHAAIEITPEVTAELSATFISDDISEITFDILAQSGASLSMDGITCMEIFGISSSEMADAISMLKKTDSLKKENTEEKFISLFDVYNSLCDDIIKMRIPTLLADKELF